MDVKRKLNISLNQDDENIQNKIGKNNNIECDDDKSVLANNSSEKNVLEVEEVELDEVDEEKLLNSINQKLNIIFHEDEDNYSKINNDDKIKLVDSNSLSKQENINELKLDINEVIKVLDIDGAKNSFDKIIIKYNVNRELAIKINGLKEFKTVFVFDDSTSMNNFLENSPLNTPDIKVKRWEELQYFADISVEIANMFNDDSKTDVYFLNREPVFDIKDSKQFAESLRRIKPRGYSPLTKVFENVIENNKETIFDKKLLVMFVTDGEPTDDHGQNDIKSFYHALQSRNHDRVFISIVVCTDDQKSIGYLTQWDEKMKNLDIVDDYQTVKNKISKAKGSKFQFSYGDYVVKAFIGSFDDELNEIDTRKNKFHYAIKKLNFFRKKTQR